LFFIVLEGLADVMFSFTFNGYADSRLMEMFF
jgi:hypothetical protein